MSTTATSPSLFADWQLRREHLLAATSASSTTEGQLRVLNYLLQRYAGNAQAQRPARFPLSKALVCNERRVVVFHHLGRAGLHDSKNRREAEQQVLSVLRRMHTIVADPAEFDGPAASSAPRGERYSHMYWRSVIRAMKVGMNVDQRIRASLKSSPYLPRTIIQHLCQRLQNTAVSDVAAAQLLVACRNPQIIEWTMRMWRLRVSTNASVDPVRHILEDHFRVPDMRHAAAEKVRAELASDDPKIRLAAISLIAQIGDLDDLGLLMDLLSLPQNEDESPGEREALEQALWALRSCGHASS